MEKLFHARSAHPHTLIKSSRNWFQFHHFAFHWFCRRWESPSIHSDVREPTQFRWWARLKNICLWEIWLSRNKWTPLRGFSPRWIEFVRRKKKLFHTDEIGEKLPWLPTVSTTPAVVISDKHSALRASSLGVGSSGSQNWKFFFLHPHLDGFPLLALLPFMLPSCHAGGFEGFEFRFEIFASLLRKEGIFPCPGAAHNFAGKWWRPGEKQGGGELKPKNNQDQTDDGFN